MKLVQADDIERRRGLEHRGGTFFSRTLISGKPRTPGNFKISLSENNTDHFGPRHRHNFDQYRFMISGVADFARDGKLTPGMLGYFPEGVSYGPQTNLENTFVIVLQFGGASGSGYLQPVEVKRGMEELKASGEFREGLFHRNPGVPGRRRSDPYQAIWEHFHGRVMEFPKPRYQKPVFVDSAHFDWLPIGEGVGEKLLGMFTECRTQAALLRLEADARHRLAGRGLWVALCGGGRIGDAPLRKHTTLFLDHGESAEISATENTQLLHYGLPDLRHLERARGELTMAAE